MLKLEVGIGRRQAQLKHETIELVDDQHHGHTLTYAEADDRLRIAHNPLDGIDDQHDTISEPKRGRYFVLEICVAWCVHHVDEEALASRIREHERHGRRSDRQSPVLLQHMCICVAEWFFRINIHAVSLFHQHIHKTRLAVR